MTGDMLIVVRTFLGSAAVITVVASFFRLRRRVRELEAEAREEEMLHADRLDALEIAVERLAAQLEQVTSGQEFLNRVVANQPGRLPSPTQSPPVVTPH
jgi:hypothetical protein